MASRGWSLKLAWPIITQSSKVIPQHSRIYVPVSLQLKNKTWFLKFQLFQINIICNSDIINLQSFEWIINSVTQIIIRRMGRIPNY